MSACVFCELSTGPSDALVALRTPRVFVVPALKQRRMNRGHMLILPTEHITSLATAEEALLSQLYRVAGQVSVAVRKAFDATGATLFQNESAPDQILHHLHIHVVPRAPGDAFRMPDPSGQELTLRERELQAAALRRELA